MEFPLILSENGDLSFYRSLEMAERSLEVIDVVNGEYEGFDAIGRSLRLTPVSKNRVQISLVEQSPLQIQHLETLVRNFLTRFGADRPIDCSLSELLSYCDRFIER